MAGMLSDAQPSSGPGPHSPPTGNPVAGTPPPGGAAAGPGQPPQATASFEELRDQGVQRLYGENFDQLIEMFQTNGAQNFPRSMAIAVNSTIEYLEQQNGPLPPEQAAEVGMDIMMKLLEDMIVSEVVPDVTLEQVQQSLPAILVMYADSHPNVSKQDVQQLMIEVQRGAAAQGEAPQTLPSDAATPGGPK